MSEIAEHAKRRVHRLSFSRLLGCLWWARGDVDCPDDPPGEKARIGTIVHRLSQEFLVGVPYDRSKANLGELAEALSIFDGPLRTWLDAWMSSPGDHHVEERLRYDAESDCVFAVPRREDPAYAPPGAMQMTGELDLVTVLPTHIEVIDIKTGQKRNSNESQLTGYSLVAARKWDRPLVKSAFLYARKTKVELTPWIEMDVDALDAEAGKLRKTLRTLPQAEPIKGDWCWRCPLGPRRGGPPSRCPAWQDDYSPPPAAPATLLDDDTRLF